MIRAHFTRHVRTRISHVIKHHDAPERAVVRGQPGHQRIFNISCISVLFLDFVCRKYSVTDVV
jgi:hypothetical protein